MRRLLPRASCALLGALAYVPILTQQPTADLDASWGAVLQEAARRGWQFGPDIAFTYGPLGYLAVPFFAPDFFWWTVGARLLIGAVCGWAIHDFATRAGWPAWLPTLAFFAVLPPTMAAFDVPWLLPTLLWPFLAVSEAHAPGPERQLRPTSRPAGAAPAARPPRGASRPSLALIGLSAVVGLTALVKFTLAALGGLLAVLLLLDDVGRRRRPPAATLVFVATALCLWVASGQALGHLATWLSTSWQMSSAYSETMSTPVGPYQQRELAVFAVNAVALLAAALRQRDTSRPGLWRLIPTAALSLLLFVQFKLGFVRHDAHATAAFFALPILGLLVGAPGLARTARRRERVIAGALIVLGLGSYAYGLRRYFDRLPVPEHYRAYYAIQAQSIAAALRPFRLHAGLSAQRDAALARLRRDAPLPSLHGTVDVYGHRQGYALAHTVAYRPRPVFQSYGAYTTALAALNRRFVESAGGTRHVLFDPGTTDFRYPLLDDGASLPALLTRFDVRATVPPFVHLERRTTARTLTLVPIRAVGVGAGETLAIEETAAPIWARIDIHRSPVGRLLATAFKLPPINAYVTTADGHVRQHRLLRDVAAGGMLLSPTVTTLEQFVQLHALHPAGASQRVVALRVDLDWTAAYDSRIDVTLARLEVR